MKKMSKLLAILLVLAMVLPMVPVGVAAADDVTLDYGIVHLDCGRKYFSVDSIKSIIDATKEAGMNYVQLAIGNDAMRFLLDDMTLTVGETTYDSESVQNAIHAGNEAYYNFDVDELTQSDMDTIIAYAKEQGVGIIPLINNPGHMDAILDAGEALTGKTLSYNGSGRTIDVTNSTATAFTKALLQMYIDYFADKGCSIFNMGADEYANDIYTSGGMGFGQLQTYGQYGYFVEYVNEVAAMIKKAGMTPMAFNDGIYYNSNTTYTFDTGIVIQYWSSGWSGYNVASASFLQGKGHELVNAHGDYYWVLGKSDWQCSTTKAAAFDYTAFQGGTISDPAGVAFLIWCDYPGAGTEASVVSATTPVIQAFNHPTIAAAVWNDVEIVVPEVPEIPDAGNPNPETEKTDDATGITVSGSGLTGLTVENVTETVSFSKAGYALVAAYDITPEGIGGEATVKIPTTLENGTKVSVFHESGDDFEFVTSTTVADGSVTFNATSFSIYLVATGEEITVENNTVPVEIEVGESLTYRDNSGEYSNYTGNESGIVNVTVTPVGDVAGENICEKVTSITSGSSYLISDGNGNYLTLSDGKLTNTTDPNSATKWTITDYYTGYTGYAYRIYSGTTYLHYNDGLTTTNSANRVTAWYYDSNSGFYRYYYTSYYLRFNSSDWEATTTSSNYGAPYIVQQTEPVAAHTDITFTGLLPGATTVTVGATTYNITVKAKVATVDVSLNLSANNTYTMYTAGTGETVTYTMADGYDQIITVDGSVITATALGSTTVTATVAKSGVTIATYTYNVTVQDKTPDDALTDTTLNVEFWITNVQVTADGGTSMAIINADAGTETGLNLANTVPSPGTSSYGTMYYWKTVLLDSQNHQTNVSSDDETADGITMVAVRFRNNAWQYQNTAGEWNYIKETDQVVAYYLQNIEVTTEIDTLVKDWGYSTDAIENTSGGTGQVSLTIAVVYPDGTMSPTEDQLYAESTVIFNWWPDTGRDIGIIAPVNNSDYDISRMTVVRGERTNNKDATYWYISDTITWETYEAAEGVTKYVEQVVWDADTATTDPMVNGLTDNVAWSDKNESIMILIYLEPKDTSLTVKYYDDTNSTEIFEFGINAPKEALFTTHLVDYKEEPTTSGSFDIGESAYIVNTSGVKQYINLDLVDLALIYPDVPSIYSTGLYGYRYATLSEDGKTLTIHYVLKEGTITDPTYVVDFGLPFTFNISDVVVPVGNYTALTYVKALEIMSNGDFGTLAYDATSGDFTYTPTKVMTRLEIVSVRLQFIDNTYKWAQIGFAPATTVYYEEGFAQFGTGWNVDNGGEWGGNTTLNFGNAMQHVAKYTESTDADGNKILKLKDGATEYNYGYDPIYATMAATKATSSKVADTFRFTFTGTGTDIFANCDGQSGLIVLRITDANGSVKKVLTIDTKNNGAYTTGGMAINTPIASISDLPHGSYIVTGYVVSGTFNFDGFRVYNSFDTSLKDDGTHNNPIIYSAYQSVLEEDPSFYELRDAVLAGLNVNVNEGQYAGALGTQVYSQLTGDDMPTATTGALVLGSGDVDVQSLLDNGPKNELYLTAGQSVTFKLNTSRQAQIGLRSVDGSEVKYTINNGSEVVLNSSVDMFYDLKAQGVEGEQTYTIAVTSGILSITDIKISDCVEGEIFGALTEEDITAALVAMGIPKEPAPFEPTISMGWITRTVRVGQTAILTITTSPDVESLTVNGQALRGQTVRGCKIWVYIVRCNTPGVYSYDVVAVNADGVAAETVQAPALTVNQGSFWGFFGKFF